MGKVVEKVVVEQLAQYCKTYFKLYLGQIKVTKERSTIDAIVILVHTRPKKQTEKKIVGALFMDVTKAFDYVSRKQLLQCIIELGINGNLVASTRFFLTNQKIQLVIDGYKNKEREIETEIP